jgi:hypothetical protein
VTAQETIHTIKQGSAGMGASAAGIGMSMVEQIEHWLQIASLTVGLMVGLITLYNLTIKKWKK